ncbi:hypothetical protein CUMW_280810 [Citrus unshiu]|uniref:Uncharacterized protein n=1 Tax=Citrus unshiu TaxID=55188 RepID=A0A2H5MV52_CITUN|nr:hypothetical protein CUMW_280810 [Citrus unshiu]
MEQPGRDYRRRVREDWLVMGWEASIYGRRNGANTCALNGTKCAIYTQVVWRNSVRLGCAKERCNKQDARPQLVICQTYRSPRQMFWRNGPR